MATANFFVIAAMQMRLWHTFRANSFQPNTPRHLNRATFSMFQLCAILNLTRRLPFERSPAPAPACGDLFARHLHRPNRRRGRPSSLALFVVWRFQLAGGGVRRPTGAKSISWPDIVIARPQQLRGPSLRSPLRSARPRDARHNKLPSRAHKTSN